MASGISLTVQELQIPPQEYLSTHAYRQLHHDRELYQGPEPPISYILQGKQDVLLGPELLTQHYYGGAHYCPATDRW